LFFRIAPLSRLTGAIFQFWTRLCDQAFRQPVGL
jgi:hypothetical protein